MHRKACLSSLAGAALCLLPISAAFAQGKPTNGMREADLRTHAIVGATVVTAPGVSLDGVTIVIRDGIIEAVGPGAPVPAGARVWPADGLTVYAGLIDAALLVKSGDRPESPGAHWNDLVHPEVRLAELDVVSASDRKGLRSLGFTAAAVYPSAGILRGTGAVIALGDNGTLATTYDEAAAMGMGFDTAGGWGNPVYPGSLMGSIALARQTLLDARWHATCRAVYEAHPEGNEPPAPADALVALDDVLAGRQEVLFDARTELNALRAARLAEEFDLRLVLLGNGLEFRRLDEISGLGVPVIVPLSYPKRPDATSLARTDRVSLRDMMTWEQAPTNPRRLGEAGVTFALTSHRLKSRKDFHAALRKAVTHGLAEADALAALTTTPAAMLGLERVMGTIEPGKVANLVVVDGSLFDKKMKIRDTWIDGRRYEINAAPEPTVAFKGTLRGDDGLALPLELDTKKPSMTFVPDEGEKTRAKKVTILRSSISVVVDGAPFDADGYVRLSGTLTGDDTVIGTGELPDGDRFAFTITREGDLHGGDDATETPAEAGEAPADTLTGEWSLLIQVPQMPDGVSVPLSVTLDEDGRTFEGELEVMGQPIEFSEGTFEPATGGIEFAFTGTDGNAVQVTGTLEGDTLAGAIASPMINAEYEGSRVAAGEPGGGEGSGDEATELPPDALVTPLGAYGRPVPPQRENVLVTNATIWTCEDDTGILDGADLLIVDGTIRAIGENLAGTLAGADAALLETATVIDATGKHVTPGLIDCHSHTGITGGVNEYTQTNTAEVRIGDCIDPDSVNWYRQLAGGLTACNQLHGSANPIGGQNSVVKLKWGSTAEDLRIDDAIPGIKFALGENVKRSEGRYPNTRMGVETFIRDAFTAARDYERAWQRYNELSTDVRERTMPPRRDLELETLVQILNGKRLVHCHSYRQDEILMLIRVADDFGFTIGTFQHVLEGFKVADAIAAHGAGASSFSDWWAYKVEVMDAIPYSGTLMNQVGVNVSFNSDSSELARRMNTEASKAVRYGGLDPHEALKFVTINPAWQLRIDHRTGSLKPGKDADFVIWSDDPLSTYARCEQTWIEGARYFDVADDRRLRESIASERQRLVQKILADAHGEPPSLEEETTVSAEEPTEWANLSPKARAWIEERLRLEEDPLEMAPGDCGCGGLHRLMEQH
jgi:N-acetylglucosamine-6-phosphate deacetylase